MNKKNCDYTPKGIAKARAESKKTAKPAKTAKKGSNAKKGSGEKGLVLD